MRKLQNKAGISIGLLGRPVGAYYLGERWVDDVFASGR